MKNNSITSEKQEVSKLDQFLENFRRLHGLKDDEGISILYDDEECVLYEFEFTTKETIVIDRINRKVPHLYFICPLEGDFEVIYPDGTSTFVKPYQTFISFSSKEFPYKTRFPKGEFHHYFTVVIKPVNPDDETSLFFKLFRFFDNKIDKSNKTLISGLNPTLNDIFSQIGHDYDFEFYDKILIKSSIKLLIGKVLSTLENYEEAPEIDHELTDHEIQQVVKLTEMIHKDPGKKYRVDKLCRIGGLSVTKLQEGFKRMHGNTVAKYIQHVRLERAEKYIRTSDMNISEVVYSIGLSSRSYFSKIFRQKYNCKPSDYQQQIRRQRMAQ